MHDIFHGILISKSGRDRRLRPDTGNGDAQHRRRERLSRALSLKLHCFLWDGAVLR